MVTVGNHKHILSGVRLGGQRNDLGTANDPRTENPSKKPPLCINSDLTSSVKQDENVSDLVFNFGISILSLNRL